MQASHPAAMGRTVLVTGGSKRIGREICLRLALDGFAVAVHHRNSEPESLEVVEEILSIGSDAFSVRCDLSETGAASRLIGQCQDELGPITDLVNNASIFEYDDIFSVTEGSWDSHMAINARAQTMLIRALAEGMPDGESGSVVNIIDQKIASPNPDYLSYTASRFAMLGMTETLARALSPKVRVNAVAPGHTLASPEQTDSGFAKAQAETPLGYGPEPGDVAEAASFLLNSKAVTGQVIFVDCGERFLNRGRDVVFETEG
ncbi:MAG: short chain dehydrogenase [Euryarchaeota archaeon]|nr:short chain dehydrogenase [Euryarchaeota archaeon]|tara:strand:- start:610 stop:1392 length:783 start_codon:yes stop_codon:yes gene_type:complete